MRAAMEEGLPSTNSPIPSSRLSPSLTQGVHSPQIFPYEDTLNSGRSHGEEECPKIADTVMNLCKQGRLRECAEQGEGFHSRELQFCTSHLRITSQGPRSIDRSKHSEATCADLFSLSICARGAWDVGCVQRQLALRYCVCVSRGKWKDLKL